MTSHTSKFEAMPLMEKDEDWEDPDDLVLGPLNSVLENMKYNSRTISRSELWKAILFASTLSFVAGVTVPYIFYSLIFHRCASDTFYMKTINGISENIFSEIKEDGIKLWQKKLGELNSSMLPFYIKEEWQKQGLDKVNVISHNIEVSLPSKKKSSKLLVIENIVQGSEFKTLNSAEDDVSVQIKPLCCASVVGTTYPIEGDLLFANFGRYEDFLKLSKLNIDINGKIVIIKYGMIPTANKVMLAHKFGAKGVILFPSKSSGIKDGKVTNTSCNTLLPEETVYFCPASDNQYLFRKMNFSTIPVFPITNEDAEKLLRKLTGPNEPNDWNSGELSHNIGPGFKEINKKIIMEIHADDVNWTIYNIVGKLHGKIETDRSIVVGSLSRSNNASGLSILLEIAHVFAKFLKNGIRPRRNILFCVWGTGDHFGIHSIDKWIEDHKEYLETEAVAYIDVDTLLAEHYQLIGTPMMLKEISEAVQKVLEHKEHDVNILIAEQFNSSYLNIKMKSRLQHSITERQMLFYNILGVPSAFFQYECKSVTPCQFVTDCSNSCCYSEEFGEFQNIVVLAQIWTKIIHSLSHSPMLHFDTTSLAIYLNHSLKELEGRYGKLLEENSVSLSNLNDSIEEFVIATDYFQKILNSVDNKDFYIARSFNDKLMRVGRLFVIKYPSMKRFRRNLLYGPSNIIACSMTTFPEITDLLLQLSIENATRSVQTYKKLQEEIAAMSSHIKSAAKILYTDL